jgi:hypothetical protein
MTQVTDHAARRVSQRVRPRRMGKTVQGVADEAFALGVRFVDSTGWTRKYLKRVYRRKGTANNACLYLGHTWVFCSQTLVTVWRGPEVRHTWKRLDIRRRRYAGRRECRRYGRAA